MGISDLISKIRERRKEETIKITPIEPEKESIRSIDYGTETQERVGGATVVTSISGGTSKVTSVSRVGQTPTEIGGVSESTIQETEIKKTAEQLRGQDITRFEESREPIREQSKLQESAEERRERILKEYESQNRERSERLSKKEEERIEKAEKRILVGGGKTSTKILTDKETGDKIEVTTIKIEKIINGRKIKERVITRRNLNTGEIEKKTYKYDPKTKKVKLTGGIKKAPLPGIFASREIPTKEATISKLDITKDKGLSFQVIKEKIKKLKDIKPEKPTKEEIFEIFKPKDLPTQIITKTIEKKPKEEITTEILEEQIETISRPSRIMDLSAIGLGKLITDIGFKTEKVVPEKKVKIIEEQFGTIQRDPLTGKEISFYKEKEIIIPERKRRTLISYLPEAIRFGAYAVPIAGEIIFASDIGRATGKVVLPEQEIKYLGLEDTKITREEVKREGIKELAFAGGIVATARALKGVKAIKRLRITEAEKELKKLGEQPIKYLEVIEKPQKRIELIGFQKTPRLERRIEIKGKIAKTEGGLEFIPGAEGRVITRGQIKKLGKRELVEIQTFETGAKGISKPIENLGKLTLYQNIGVSTFVPKAQTFALFKPTKRGVKIAEAQFQKNIQLGGQITKNLQLSQTLMKGKKFGLTIGKENLGITIIRETKPTKVLGKRYFTETKTPLGKTFAKQIPEQLQTPKLDIKKIKTRLEKLKLKKPEVIKEVPLSLYAGTGLYERTEFYGVPTQKINAIIKPSLMQVQTQIKKIEYTKPIQIMKQEIKSRLKEKQVASPKIEMKQKLDLVQKQPQQIKQAQKQKIETKLKLKIKQKLDLVQKQPQQIKQAQKQKIETKLKLKPKIKIPEKSPALDFIKSVEGDFKVKVRKGGKDIKIGEAKTKEEAKKLLLERLKTTLRASGFIERGGKKVDPGFLGEGFRRSKKNQKRVVEIRKKRIKRKGISFEAKEIQLFRKGRGGKNNFF